MSRHSLVFSHFLLLTSYFLLPLSPALHAAELKIGYVNVAKVFDGYDGTKASDATLEQKGKQKEGELEKQLKELTKFRESLELLNEEARASKVTELERLTANVELFKTQTARELRHERDRIANEILTKIDQTIKEYAKANGFVFILNERIVLYGQETFDVTDAVLKLLNDRYATAKKSKP